MVAVHGVTSPVVWSMAIAASSAPVAKELAEEALDALPRVAPREVLAARVEKVLADV
jgi:hypothetical protein